MPSNIVKSFSDKSGKSLADVEKLWNDAEGIVKKDYSDVPVNSDKYYSLVVGVLKNMLKLEEPSITTTSMGGDNSLFYDKIGYEKKMKKVKKYS